ncbi:MAG: endonuclease [Myxococcales bacterium]|nr:endonuclease [Myxococcales bacterium]
MRSDPVAHLVDSNFRLGRRDKGRLRAFALLGVSVAALLALPAQHIGADPPVGYYGSADTSSASALRTSLHEIIDDHQRLPYTSTALDTWDVLEEADEDPLDAGSIVDVYLNQSFAKNGGGGGGYIREHAWPKSYGFPVDGSLNYPYTDCHHLFLSDESYNSSRSNKPYDQCDASCTERPTVAGTGGGYPGASNWTTTGKWETWVGRRGDVARALFYTDVRYEGGLHGGSGAAEPDLVLTEDLAQVVTSGSNVSLAYMGRLSVLLQWHAADPVDDVERARNDAVFAHQQNRNPFIDHPEWVACVFAASCSGGPAAPTGLVVQVQGGGAQLDWQDNAEPDLAGYHVRRALSPGGGYQQRNTSLLTTSEFFDSPLQLGSTYDYTVSAVNSLGSESSQSAVVSVTHGPSPWINEIHYDNAGADSQEGFEIAGLAGTSLTGWQVVAYNGSGGTVMASLALAGVLPDAGDGFGFAWFDMAPLQNGPADGLALVDPSGAVVEFLSWEGVVTPGEGPALGIASTDIGSSEGSGTALGDSLQRVGTGGAGADFSWTAPAAHTRAAVNTEQVLVLALGVPSLSPVALLGLAGLLLAAAAPRVRRAARGRRSRP